jgi:hypothetical protein
MEPRSTTRIAEPGLIIIGYIMPFFGLELLGMIRDVAAFNLPARVSGGVEIGECRGAVWVPRRVFQRLLPEQPTPSAASKPTFTSSGPGSRASPSGSCAGGPTEVIALPVCIP